MTLVQEQPAVQHREARPEVTQTALGIPIQLDYASPPANCDVPTTRDQLSFVRWFLERAYDVYLVMTEHDSEHFGNATERLAHVQFHHRCPCCAKEAPTLVFSYLDDPQWAHAVRTFECALDAVFMTELNRARTPWLEKLDYNFVAYDPLGEVH